MYISIVLNTTRALLISHDRTISETGLQRYPCDLILSDYHSLLMIIMQNAVARIASFKPSQKEANYITLERQEQPQVTPLPKLLNAGPSVRQSAFGFLVEIAHCARRRVP